MTERKTMKPPVFFIALCTLLSTFPSSAHGFHFNRGFQLCLASHSFPPNLIYRSFYYFDHQNHTFSSDKQAFSSLLQSSLQNLKFNTSTTLKPKFILTPKNASHIQTAVICSRRSGLQIRVRSGGHDYEGLSYTSKSTHRFVVVDLVEFREVSIDLKSETAWVQAGATIGELYYQIANKSRTLGFPAGVCPTMGVGGHISGGGQGTMMRKYGLAADNVVDATIVDAGGKLHNRKSMGENLFWAIRGGGAASFGVVVSWKIKLVRVPPKVTVFTIPKTLEQGATKLVKRWQEIADKFDKDLFIRIFISVGKNSKGKKTIQANFNSLYLGKIKKLIPLMEKSFPELGLKASNCTEMSWIESILYFNDGKPEGESIDVLMDRKHYIKGYFKAKSDFVEKPISEKGLKSIWKVFMEGEAGVMIWDPYGGRMAEIRDTETPFPHRAGTLYNIQYYSGWKEGGIEAERKHVSWINKLHNFMGAFVTKNPRAAYLNYRDLDLGVNQLFGYGIYFDSKRWGDTYFKDNYERLASIKYEVDPVNFFRNEQSIPPIHPMQKKNNREKERLCLDEKQS